MREHAILVPVDEDRVAVSKHAVLRHATGLEVLHHRFHRRRLRMVGPVASRPSRNDRYSRTEFEDSGDVKIGAVLIEPQVLRERA